MLKILLSGGGTLGSVSPLIAIKEAFPEADYLFVGTRVGPERVFVRAHGIRYTSIVTSKFRRYLSVKNISDALKFPIGLLQALYVVARYRPDVVLTSGSFVSVPIAIAGRLWRSKVFLHQQDITLGLANKLISHVATVITTTFEDQAQLFPNKKTHWTGNPVRTLKIRPHYERKLILILGGSTGAHGLNLLVNSVIPELVNEYEVIHMLGKDNFHQRLTLPHNYTPVTFLGSEYEAALEQASLVISRAGMATITELAQFGKAMLLVPMPDTHQEDNAKYFDAHGAAIMVSQQEPLKLREALRSLLHDQQKRESLIVHMRSLFPAQATARYRALIMQTVQGTASKKKPVVFFIGIGGIGVSALVAYFQERGYTVMGSDLTRATVTKKLEAEGIKVFYEHNKSNLPRETIQVIYSSAVPENNEELVEARRRHLSVHSYNEYIGTLSAKYRTVAISGTHGKSTTTALTGFVLRSSGSDPTIIVGSLIPQFGGKNYVHGKDRLLVIEADEYRAHMLLLKPNIIVINNLEADHLDFYRDLADLKTKFDQFVSLLPANGTLIKNADDPNLAHYTGATTVTYGIDSPDAAYRAAHITIADRQQHFEVYKHGARVGAASIQLPGRFNVYNALAAFTVADQLHLPVQNSLKALGAFTGLWRRFEHVGTYKGALVYSDYAHHPTAIQVTLQGFKDFFPDKKILLVFQPHSFDRTEKLFTEFVRAFSLADELILTEVYDVAGRDQSRNVSSRDIFKTLNQHNAYYAATLDDVQKVIDQRLTADHILVIMGAGNVDMLARTLVS